ncbi:MAG: hypothetical protein ACOYEH_01150 [Caldicoprobacterales bacterium]|jgi:hypothetical protein|nr:hypothetical protein [Clostridiales bacterium]
MQLTIFLPLMIAIILAISACTVYKGSIVILENPSGKGFTMDFKEWSSINKRELSLNNGDVLQFEVAREAGEIALVVSGKNSTEPYTGNDVRSGIFTVTVPESDIYVIRITGKNATGKVTVKNLQSSDE